VGVYFDDFHIAIFNMVPKAMLFEGDMLGADLGTFAISENYTRSIVFIYNCGI